MAILAISCGRSDVKIEISDDVAREKYKYFLEIEGIEYTVSDGGVIHIQIDPDDLQDRMQEYEEWKQEYWERKYRDNEPTQ